jgi:hypothetical protein
MTGEVNAFVHWIQIEFNLQMLQVREVKLCSVVLAVTSDQFQSFQFREMEDGRIKLDI